MDARELTKVVNDLSDRVIHLESDNNFLYNEVMKLRVFIGDIQIDIKDLLSRQVISASCRKGDQ